MIGAFAAFKSYNKIVNPYQNSIINMDYRYVLIFSRYLCFSTNSKDSTTVVAKRVGSVGGAWIGAGAGTPGGRDTFWGIAGVEGIPIVKVVFLI